MTTSITIDFVSQTIQLDACQERKTAGVSRKKAKKYAVGIGLYLSLNPLTPN